MVGLNYIRALNLSAVIRKTCRVGYFAVRPQSPLHFATVVSLHAHLRADTAKFPLQTAYLAIGLPFSRSSIANTFLGFVILMKKGCYPKGVAPERLRFGFAGFYYPQGVPPERWRFGLPRTRRASGTYVVWGSTESTNNTFFPSFLPLLTRHWMLRSSGTQCG